MLGFLKNKRSLRATLVVSFLLLSLFPLLSITFFFYQKYGTTINDELEQRIEVNSKQLLDELTKFLETQESILTDLSADKALKYYFFTENKKKINEIVREKLQLKESVNIIFNSQLEVISENYNQEFLKKLDINKAFTEANQLIFLKSVENKQYVCFLQKISSDAKRSLGYLFKAIDISPEWVAALEKKVAAKVLYLNTQQVELVSSSDSINMADKTIFFKNQLSEKLIDVNYSETPFAFKITNFSWKEIQLPWAVGVSKEGFVKALDEIRNTIILIVFISIVVLILLSILISSSIMKPLYRLLESTENLQKEQFIEVPESGFAEIQKITNQFNLMSKEIYSFQNRLKTNFVEIKESSDKLKNAQSQLVHSEKMASLGQLVAGVAHELNNPIGFIHSNVQYLDEYTQTLFKLIKTAKEHPEQLDKELKDCDFDYLEKDFPKLIRSCKEGAQRTRDIVVGLRSFSRLDEAVLKEVDINQSIDETLNLLVGEIKHRIEVIKNYGDLPPVTCYSSQLNQVFMNLLSNAAQAIEGEGVITITTESKDDGFVSISIKDSGKGIKKKDLEHIFDPFFTTKEQGQGTGLGLSISYGIIEKHRGKIEVKSVVKKGTEFIITIPIS
ncbi:ATP-binding protein [bacterium]|nr:ATP-binding protein [bacterium]